MVQRSLSYVFLWYFSVQFMCSDSYQLPVNNVTAKTSLFKTDQLCDVLLDFSNVGLTAIGTNFISSPRVTRLVLQNNGIANIAPGAFNELPNLSYLDLSNNNIMWKDFTAFGNHSNLETLILDNNQGLTPTEQYSASSYGLQYYKNKYIKREIKIENHYPSLKHLHLRNVLMNKLTSDWNKCVPNLTHLYISDNIMDMNVLLETLPSTVTNMHLDKIGLTRLNTLRLGKLELLSLNDNIFNTVSNNYCYDQILCLKNLYNLTELSLSNCEIQKIDERALENVPNLVSLNLSKNRFKTLPHEILDSVLNLQTLNLSKNSIEYLPDICSLHYLTTLILDDMENITSFVTSNAYCELPNLQVISLRNNNLEKISSEFFHNLPALEEIDLSGNKLRSLPQSVSKTKLKYINLRSNLIEDIDSLSLDMTESLEMVILQDNHITNFSTNVMKYLPNNLTVFI